MLRFTRSLSNQKKEKIFFKKNLQMFILHWLNSQIRIPQKTSPETLYEGQPNGIVHTSCEDFSDHPKGVKYKLSQIIYKKSLSTQFCIVKRLRYLKFCLVCELQLCQTLQLEFCVHNWSIDVTQYLLLDCR
jgi:hypothetical protein